MSRNSLKRLVIDLDGTICTEEKTFDKFLAKPQKDAINTINALYHKYYIIIYTARGWAEFSITESWLRLHNIKYDILMCGKPIYDHWIDDRAIQYNSWKAIKKIL